MTTVLDKHPIQVQPCEQFNERQLFFFTADNELRREELCLDFSRPRNTVLPFKCRVKNGPQVDDNFDWNLNLIFFTILLVLDIFERNQSNFPQRIFTLSIVRYGDKPSGNEKL
jgi:hypothetical protein